MDIFFIPVLSWALIPDFSGAQTSGLCSGRQSGLFWFLELLEQRVLLPLHLAEPRQVRELRSGRLEVTPLVGRGTTRTHQPGRPAHSWLPSDALPVVLLAFLLLYKRRRGRGKTSDLGDHDALRARQPLVFEATSPRSKVASAPSVIRLMAQMLTWLAPVLEQALS